MSFKITSAEFVTSAPSLKEAPPWSLPEIVMVGRSNVGKSSLINTLVNRKGLAKTSNTPGKTRLMNFYKINERFAFVDLPGYGYARVSKTMQAQWKKQLTSYMEKRKNLVLVIQLIDSRHGPQESDEQMLAWLNQQNLPVVLVMTKGDKISRTELAKQEQAAVKKLGISPDNILTFSAQTGYGKDALLSCLGHYLETVTQRPE
jgi:GTP-binding protein